VGDLALGTFENLAAVVQVAVGSRDGESKLSDQPIGIWRHHDELPSVTSTLLVGSEMAGRYRTGVDVKTAVSAGQDWIS
jgi:hypothetical protein